MLKRILPIALIVIVLAGVLVWSQQQKPLEKVSGVIEADEIRLGSRVGGRVKEVKVEEGEAVTSGQPLVLLEEFDLREQLAEAAALRDQRKQELAKLNAGLQAEEIAQAKARYDQALALVARMERKPLEEEYEVARARMRLANAQLERAQQSQKRLIDIAGRQPEVVAKDELDRAAEEFRVAKANAEVAQAELTILDIGTREEEKQEARAQRDEALAAWELSKNYYRDEDKAKAPSGAGCSGGDDRGDQSANRRADNRVQR